MKAIIVFGLPGSGKSYFAEKLAGQLSAVYLSSDQLRMTFGAKADYSDPSKMQVYDLMRDKTMQAVQSKEDIVLDATFYKQKIRDRFSQWFDDLGVPVLFIEIRTDHALLVKRLSSKREYSDADCEVYKAVEKQFEPMQTPHLVIESREDNITQMLKKGLEYVHESESNSKDIIAIENTEDNIKVKT